MSHIDEKVRAYEERLRRAYGRIEASKHSPRYHAAPTIHNFRLIRDWMAWLSITCFLGYWTITGLNWASLHGIFWLGAWLWPTSIVPLLLPGYFSLLALVFLGVFFATQVSIWVMHIPGFQWVDDDPEFKTGTPPSGPQPRVYIIPQDEFTHSHDWEQRWS